MALKAGNGDKLQVLLSEQLEALRTATRCSEALQTCLAEGPYTSAALSSLTPAVAQANGYSRSSSSRGFQSIRDALMQRCCGPSAGNSHLTDPLLEAQHVFASDITSLPQRGSDENHIVEEDGDLRPIQRSPHRKTTTGGKSPFRTRSTQRLMTLTELDDTTAQNNKRVGGDRRSAASLAPVSTPDGRHQTQAQAVFEGHLATRKALETTLRPPTTSIEDLYKTSGYIQAIARSREFQNITIAVIAANALWIGIDFDCGRSASSCDMATFMKVADTLFCLFFTFEISVRLAAFRRTRDALTSLGFLFDFVLITLMIWETWMSPLIQYWMASEQEHLAGSRGFRSVSVLRIFRIFRLLRVARIARLLRTVPEVAILVKGMAQAMRSMFVTLTILALVIYLFAVLMTQLLVGTTLSEPGSPFARVLTAMNYMLTEVLCGFDIDIFQTLLQEGVAYYLIWLCFVVLAQLTIMNMLIGILCDVVNGAAEAQKESAVMEDMEHQILQLDLDATGEITMKDLKTAMHDPDIVQRLDQLGVDVSALVDFADFVMADIGSIPVAEFVEMVAQFRGSKTATVKDIVDLRKFVSMEVLSLWESMRELIVSEDASDAPLNLSAATKSIDVRLGHAYTSSTSIGHGSRRLDT